MTDTIQAPAAPPAEDVRARNKTIIFDALAAAGIHRVTVEYDGSGDSGLPRGPARLPRARPGNPGMKRRPDCRPLFHPTHQQRTREASQ